MGEIEITEKHLFAPKKNRNIRKQYPELLEIEEFKESRLTNQQMLYVWAYCNYFANIKDKKEKIAKSIIYAFDKELSSDEYARYMSENYSNEVRAAIDRMKRFDVTVRLESKLMTDKIFDIYGKIVSLDLADIPNLLDEKNKPDFDKINKYVNSTEKIMNTMDLLIKKKEDGYGINTTPMDIDERTESRLEKYHKRSNNN